MAIPKSVKQSITELLDGYCKLKVPPEYLDRLKIGFKLRGNSVTLFEKRPSFFEKNAWDEIVVAKFRYDPDSGKWTLYCADRNSKWHEYYEMEPTEKFDDLLQEVEEDPTGIFWG